MGIFSSIVEWVTVRPEQLIVTINNHAIVNLLGHSAPPAIGSLELLIDVQPKRAGRAVRLITNNGTSASKNIDSQLISLLRKARDWWTTMQEEGLAAASISRREGVNDSYISRIIRLNFLAPDIVEAIACGKQPAMLTAERIKTGDFPICWKKQRDLFGFSAK